MTKSRSKSKEKRIRLGLASSHMCFNKFHNHYEKEESAYASD